MFQRNNISFYFVLTIVLRTIEIKLTKRGDIYQSDFQTQSIVEIKKLTVHDKNGKTTNTSYIHNATTTKIPPETVGNHIHVGTLEMLADPDLCPPVVLLLQCITYDSRRIANNNMQFDVQQTLYILNIYVVINYFPRSICITFFCYCKLLNSVPVSCILNDVFMLYGMQVCLVFNLRNKRLF